VALLAGAGPHRRPVVDALLAVRQRPPADLARVAGSREGS
jgi:hypothetical protein